MRETIVIVGSVVWGIIFEWWIVCLFLLSAELALAGWVLYLIDIARPFSLVFALIFAGVFVGIPLREVFIVDKPSVFQRLINRVRRKKSETELFEELELSEA